MVPDRSAIWKSLSAPSHLSLIAGPCVIESETLCLRIAARLAQTCDRLGIVYVFKASYDKANRTSAKSICSPVGVARGYRVILCVPERFSIEKQKIMIALGGTREVFGRGLGDLRIVLPTIEPIRPADETVQGPHYRGGGDDQDQTVFHGSHCLMGESKLVRPPFTFQGTSTLSWRLF